MGGKVGLSLVVARSDNFAIGCDNRLPWDVPSDLKKFKQVTDGHPIVMGRNTFESIGRPLPGRTNIVVSREFDATTISTPGGADVHFFNDLDLALEFAEQVALSTNKEEIMVIGGAEIFEAVIDRANRVYLTEIHTFVENGDTFFRRDFEDNEWLLSQTTSVCEPGDQWNSTFRIFERRTEKKLQANQAAA